MPESVQAAPVSGDMRPEQAAAVSGEMCPALAARIRELAERMPEKAAVIFRKERVTYGALAAQMESAAAVLLAYGIRPGDRVLFTALSRPQMPAIYLGIQAAGGVPVFMDRGTTEDRALSIYDTTEAALFLTDMKLTKADGRRIVSQKAFWENVSGAAAENLRAESSAGSRIFRPDELAEMIFTTGTTGTPKGVMLSYKAVWSILSHTRDGLGIREDDVVLNPLPLHHSLGLRILRASLSAGATTVLQNGFAFGREIETNQADFGCTVLAAVPAAFELLRGQLGDRLYEVLGHFRMIETGAGSLTLEQRLRLAEKLPDTELHNTWGSSETGGAIFAVIGKEPPVIEEGPAGGEKEPAAAGEEPRANGPETDVSGAHPDTEAIFRSEGYALSAPGRETTIGRPLPDVEIRLIDPEDTPEGRCGRLALKGDMVMSGYWRLPEQTAEALDGGWLVTGDLVRQDEDGYLFMLGRIDDLIKMAGETVSPIEIENLASLCPGVAECACIGVDDDVNGKVPVLFYARRPEACGDGAPDMETALRQHLSGVLERLKMPAHYVEVDAIPRNRMKKIDRRALHEMWETERA